MEPVHDEWLSGLQRPWTEVASAIARERTQRLRAAGGAAVAHALWITECELRAARGYTHQRALDLQHHLRWRSLLDQLAG